MTTDTPRYKNPVGALIGLIAVFFLSCAQTLSEAAVIGGWDATRGGIFSLSEGSATASIRTLISTNLTGTTFTGTSVLTSAYLSTVDTVTIIAAFDGVTPITPLSSSEQTALMNFVLSGHKAMLLGDRTGFSPLVNQTLINPFGLNIAGDLLGNFPVTVTNPAASPITNGPFGQVTSLATDNPGWFDQLGSAHSIGTLNTNGQTVLAVLNPGALGPSSGAVILSSDEDIYRLNQTLILNTNAFLMSLRWV